MKKTTDGQYVSIKHKMLDKEIIPSNKAKYDSLHVTGTFIEQFNFCVYSCLANIGGFGK